MTDNTKNENQAVKNVINDKAFLANVMNMDMKNAQKALADRGVILSNKEMITIKNVVDAKINNDSELSEQILESIGGGVSAKVKNLAIAFSALALGGTAIILAGKTYQTLDGLGSTLSSVKNAADKANETLADTQRTLKDFSQAAQDLDITVRHVTNSKGKTAGHGIIFGEGISPEQWKAFDEQRAEKENQKSNSP